MGGMEYHIISFEHKVVNILDKVNVLIFRTLFSFTNSEDPDDVQHYAAFHPGLHWL